MISREGKKLLSDIIESIASIDEHLEGKRIFDEYASSKTKIVDLRNKVIHAYDTVDDILIWKIIMKDLSVLEQEAKTLLG